MNVIIEDKRPTAPIVCGDIYMKDGELFIVKRDTVRNEFVLQKWWHYQCEMFTAPTVELLGIMAREKGYTHYSESEYDVVLRRKDNC